MRVSWPIVLMTMTREILADYATLDHGKVLMDEAAYVAFRQQTKS